VVAGRADLRRHRRAAPAGEQRGEAGVTALLGVAGIALALVIGLPLVEAAIAIGSWLP
jgi:hypothetical protein